VRAPTTAAHQAAPPLLAPDAALFLDLDGTLLEVAATPTDVAVSAGLRALIDELRALLDGAVALVSGRAIAELDRLLDPLRLPVAGQHGLEWRGTDGIRHVHDAPPIPPTLLQRLERFVRDHPGTILEPKGASVALHYRGRPDAAHAASAAVTAIADERPGVWDVLHGKMVAELRPVGVHKGLGIERLLACPPFAGRRPAFVGDDWTDEDGFAAVNARDGVSVAVHVDRATQARHRLADVPAVHAWLRRSAAALTTMRERT
jgi:trehalose 6-phosphate phosphatase